MIIKKILGWNFGITASYLCVFDLCHYDEDLGGNSMGKKGRRPNDNRSDVMNPNHPKCEDDDND
ncbi:MAG: hypothetical protein EAX96_04135 [Candidatus Lokiarchaeota archaeon]|nr:hypothetical protein [Candidatus Lokiarchaeota archaeon]